MATRTENRRVNVYVNTPGAEGSLKSLRSEAAKLRNQLALLPKESKKFAATAKDYRKIQRELKGINNELRGTKSAFGNLKSAIGPLIGVTAALAAGRKAVDLFVSSAQEFAGFEQALDDLQAITGAGAVDMQFYAEMAKEVGRTTTLSAQQAVQAYKLIGSAKPELLENAEALAAVSREAIVLAEASGTTLPESAKGLTTFLNQFQLGAEESSRVINVLAAGSKFGAGEIDFLTESVSKFGPAAAAMGISIEQSAAAMEVFAEKGLVAEKSGVSFRNILVELAKSSDDLNPEVVGLQTAIENLGEKQFTTAELADKFGKQNLVAAQILTQSGDRLKYFTEQLTGTNVAYEQAAIRVDNLKGKWKQITSVGETLMINIGERMAPALNKAADATVKMLTAWNNMVKAPVEDKLDKVRVALNTQLEVLKVANLNEEQKAGFIRQINKEYGEYMPYLLNEKATIEAINTLQEKSNNLLLQRIMVMKFEKEIADLMETRLLAAEKVMETEIAIGEVKVKYKDDPTFRDEEVKKLEDWATIHRGFIEMTADNPEQISGKYADMAKELGFIWDEMLVLFNKPGTITDPNDDTNPITTAKTNVEELSRTILDISKNFENIEMTQLPLEQLDVKQWIQDQAEVRGQLNEALMSDQEFSLHQTEQHYNKLIELGKKHGFNVVALEQKKNETLKNIRAAADSERIQQNAFMLSSLSDSLGTALTAFQGMEEGWLADSKGFTAIQIMIDTASAISSMIAAAASTSLTPIGIIAKMGAGIAAVLTNMAQAKKLLSGANVPKGKSYYYGGSTGSSGGLGFGDRNGEYKGYVHDNEYVVSQSNLQIPWVTNITKAIDAIPDMIGSMDKGSSSSRLPTDNSGMEKRLDLLINIMSQEKTRPIAFPWRDIQDLKENGLDVIDKMENSRGV